MSGIEAETRAVIDEARATIDQLRSVAKMAVRANVSLVMRAGRWDGFTHDEKGSHPASEHRSPGRAQGP